MCLSVFLFIIENMKWGIIDVGGGMRDIFGTGVLDACLEKQIQFDYAIGVSPAVPILPVFCPVKKEETSAFIPSMPNAKNICLCPTGFIRKTI